MFEFFRYVATIQYFNFICSNVSTSYLRYLEITLSLVNKQVKMRNKNYFCNVIDLRYKMEQKTNVLIAFLDVYDLEN